MRQRLTWWAVLSGAIAAAALYFGGNVLATSPSGFTAMTLAKGRLGEIDVFNQLVAPPDAQLPGNNGNVWLSLQKTKGLSDLYVQSNTWLPGGSTGWHSHPGHSLIIVTAGSVTDYEGDDPSCTPHVYTFVPGQPAPAFVDRGGNHVHIIRNEGTVPASTIAVQLIPADAQRRIEAPSPGNCSF